MCVKVWQLVPDVLPSNNSCLASYLELMCYLLCAAISGQVGQENVGSSLTDLQHS